jgi:hypothetical protein
VQLHGSQIELSGQGEVALPDITLSSFPFLTFLFIALLLALFVVLSRNFSVSISFLLNSFPS